jgi:pilus assembly protein TadC
MFNDLNDGNFLIYAAKAYDKPHIIQSEFEDDLKRIKYVKRLLRKYRQTGDFKERLILNHVIILSNVFGVEATVNMLFFKVDSDDYPLLKTILIFLNYMPKRLPISFNKYTIRQEEILVDLDIANRLRNLQ